jgi:hypothetical protein
MTQHPVNWVDGMKISKKHFIDFENFIHDHIRDNQAAGLTTFNYGILPAPDAFDISIQSDYQQQVTVKVIHCKALTPAGYRIELDHCSTLHTNCSFRDLAEKYDLQSGQSHELYILLSVNPFKRKPAGEPLVDESPPRHPYTEPSYAIDILPVSAINPHALTNQLIIGKLLYHNGEIANQSQYIPAAMSVSSLPALKNWYHQFGELMSELSKYAIRIIHKIKSKDQKNQLADNVGLLATQLLQSINNQSIEYRWKIISEPPINLLLLLVHNIVTVQQTLDCLIGKDREELTGYISEWADLSSGTLEKNTQSVLSLDYDHVEIAALCQEVYQYYQMLTTTFSKLSQLEFIGKRKGQNVFIVEHEVKEPPPQQPEKKTRWSPLT